eukprot:SM000006S19504  [mRNA]  locus=s6:1172070:1179220:- [translate_table: standard]
MPPQPPPLPFMQPAPAPLLAPTNGSNIPSPSLPPPSLPPPTEAPPPASGPVLPPPLDTPPPGFRSPRPPPFPPKLSPRMPPPPPSPAPVISSASPPIQLASPPPRRRPGVGVPRPPAPPRANVGAPTPQPAVARPPPPLPPVPFMTRPPSRKAPPPPRPPGAASPAESPTSPVLPSSPPEVLAPPPPPSGMHARIPPPAEQAPAPMVQAPPPHRGRTPAPLLSSVPPTVSPLPPSMMAPTGAPVIQSSSPPPPVTAINPTAPPPAAVSPLPSTPVVFPSPAVLPPPPPHRPRPPQQPPLPPSTPMLAASPPPHVPPPPTNVPPPVPVASPQAPLNSPPPPILLLVPPPTTPALSPPPITLIAVPPPPVVVLPPPPPNARNCVCFVGSIVAPSNSLSDPCVCALPMQVFLKQAFLSSSRSDLISYLTNFTTELATGLSLRMDQVVTQQLFVDTGSNDSINGVAVTTYDINAWLLPVERTELNSSEVARIRMQIEGHLVKLDPTMFPGAYEIIYILGPGQKPPSSPPPILAISPGSTSPPSKNPATGKGQGSGGGFSPALIALVVILPLGFLCLAGALVWWLYNKRRKKQQQVAASHATEASPSSKHTGPPEESPFAANGSATNSATLSLATLQSFSGNARVFSAAELEKATDSFHPDNILGQGGFGKVYCGVLEDRTEIAVKVLLRGDNHGAKEFVAEVEMLSCLHHRNLVALLGICIEASYRCLVYELVPNGSVESHLHGVDKGRWPLTWANRLKIALGAARGLAYLHEDSNPRVIHRDFKASNILLEHDCTPKVSDFGLAKAAVDGEQNVHVTTRVMGTFGYVAPEYAMTGHLLVKSDVYSYGVVLLELLTGRRPVDMSQPEGQQNLVAWARPLLTSSEALESLVDPTLSGAYAYDDMARVAAIAAMCVNPEVTHRPFMGEVVQALKLVCTDSDEDDVTYSQPFSPSNRRYQDLQDLTDMYRRGGGVSQLTSEELAGVPRLLRMRPDDMDYSGRFSTPSYGYSGSQAVKYGDGGAYEVGSVSTGWNNEMDYRDGLMARGALSGPAGVGTQASASSTISASAVASAELAQQQLLQKKDTENEFQPLATYDATSEFFNMTTRPNLASLLREH